MAESEQSAHGHRISKLMIVFDHDADLVSYDTNATVPMAQMMVGECGRLLEEVRREQTIANMQRRAVHQKRLEDLMMSTRGARA